MPNGQEINDELEFKEHVKKLSTDEKLNYLLDKVYDLKCQISSGNGFSKKGTFISSGAVTAIILGIWEAIKFSFHIGTH